MRLEILQPFKPILSAEVHDSGGHEVIGWLHCHRLRALAGWLKVLVDRNMHGCLPYNNNPSPWPGYYDGIIRAENSHLARPWLLHDFLEHLPPVTRHCIPWAELLSDYR